MSKSFPHVNEENAPEASKALMKESIKRLWFLPKAHEVFAISPAFYDSYLSMYGNFVGNTSLTPKEQNVVFVTASTQNACEYCMNIHAFGAEASGLSKQEVKDILADQPLSDQKLEVLRQTVSSLLLNHGQLTNESKQAFFESGFTHEQLLEVLLGIGSKVMSNYANLLAESKPEREYS